jgi:hypothetical protein
MFSLQRKWEEDLPVREGGQTSYDIGSGFGPLGSVTKRGSTVFRSRFLAALRELGDFIVVRGFVSNSDV